MSRPRSRLCGIVLLSAASLLPLPRSRGEDPELRSKLDQLLEARVKDSRFSGAVLVAKDGVPIVRRGFGMADLEHEVPNAPETKFRLGSLTKQFTAAAILLLQEQGKLDVHKPVKTYLPDSPEAWDAITVHHLLNHTAGIPSYTSVPEYGRMMHEPTTPDALLGRFKDKPLEFKPGERFAYSNSGYAVLGRIIAEVSGKTYAEFVAENIFKPLGMKDSGYDDPAPLLSHRARGYARLPEGTVNARYIDMTIPYSAGALYSTVDDLLKWDQALLGDRLLSKASREAMFTPGLRRYGYVWTIAQVYGRTMTAHEGSINGFSTDIKRFPDDRVCVIVLSNIARTPVPKLSNELAAALFGKEPEARGEPAGAP